MTLSPRFNTFVMNSYLSTQHNMYRFLIVCSFILLFASCEKKQKKAVQNSPSQTIAPEEGVSTSAPQITMLDTCPQPLSFKIPSKITDKYYIQIKGINEKIEITPPRAFPITENNTGDVSFDKDYNQDQNIAQTIISCGYTDKLGNIWFGTSGGGISEYNGKNVVNYTTNQGLAGNLIKSVIEDKSGNFWFGTNGNGVSKYNGKHFTNYTTNEGLAGDIVLCIIEDRYKNLWFCTNNGISKCNNSTTPEFVNYAKENGLSDNYIYSGLEDNEGNLWFGGVQGIAKVNSNYESSKSKNIFKTYYADSAINLTKVIKIIEDKDSNIWFGTIGNGVIKLPNANSTKKDVNEFIKYSMEDGLAHSNIHGMCTDNEGNVWFGTGGGLGRYSNQIGTSKNGMFKKYGKKQGLVADVIYSLVKDNDGNIWIGTAGGGLNKFSGNSVVVFSSSQGIGGRVWSITEDSSKNLWFGTSDGLLKYDRKKFDYLLIKHLTSNIRITINDNEGNIWLGSVKGAVKYDEKTVTYYSEQQGIANKDVLSALKDSKGNFWFGTYGKGVSKFDGKSFTNYTTENGLANNVIKTIIEDNDGNIWFGTNVSGLSKFDGKKFYNYTKKQGLPSNNILSSAKDKYGNLWFGTFGGGVAIYDGEKFTTINSTIGLPNDVVYAICEDTIHKKMWIGTNLGISGLQRVSKAIDIDSLNFENFNLSTGYPIKDINTGAIFVDSYGIVWLGSDDKLVRFDYDAIYKKRTPLNVVIQSIQIKGERLSWHALNSYKKAQTTKNDSLAILNEQVITFKNVLSKKQQDALNQKFESIEFDSITPFNPTPTNLVLPYQLNDITIEFCAIETNRPQLVRYQYMLEGYDTEWRAITKQTNANFGNIYEGTYTFKLKALSPDGIWSEPITYTFKVLPPWYRTWWMYVIYITGIISSVIVVYRWRTASLRKDKEMLEKTVHERTAELVEQKEIVEEKQKEILDSINYAKRIQYTLLAHDELLTKNLENHFVLFNPKDIVSGDFYWATESKNNLTENPLFYLAACDSTGHGVPGAFMSLLNISFLNEAITEKNILTPNAIFDYVRKRLIESISKDGAQDGMDGILACFEKTTDNRTKCLYAAANNSPVLIRDNTTIDLSADKMPVGKGERLNPFTLYTIDCLPGDVLYFYTDGYADQFGGPKGKKFKYKQLDELLISIHQKNMDEQKNILQNTLNEWRGELEQVDDVLIIGIKISD
jgi:ligand-binding sensor domain-containing protein/serine phosphatase RsbU (regulator of sigma subunit)